MKYVYLLIIFGLILFINWELESFSEHYDRLSSVAEQSIKTIKDLETHCTWK